MRDHKKHSTQQFLHRWGWEELEHPTYSPDISTCDFHLIPKINEPIRGRQLATREDIAKAVRQQVTRFTHGAANGEADVVQRLLLRWQRVVTVARVTSRIFRSRFIMLTL
ncbi:uncharacterized protein TNCV_972921 [Trichonephila clavipes]|nr:uncharacterized protein TNCV_972921 [Trichonephila clavipes]